MTNESKTVQVGLVMPIAQIDSCGPEHWLEVKSIITEALSQQEQYEFETKLVSESDSIGLIHKRIVQGLYSSDIVICDVSCKNPNVMFELGMRLAFDKPTIIIKDDKTNYSFDTSGIEHIEYPRDLRFARIVEFKQTLARKTIATLEDSLKDPNHSPFLKSFGEFKVAKIDQTEVTPFGLIFDKLNEMQSDIVTLKSMNFSPISNNDPNQRRPYQRYRLNKDAEEALKQGIFKFLEQHAPDKEMDLKELYLFVGNYLKEINSPASELPNGALDMHIKDVLHNIVRT